MKKLILTCLVVLGAAALTSCDTKPCKCYFYNGMNWSQEIEYVTEGSSCSTLDYTNGNRQRLCLEEHEPDIDPGSIGREYKK
ncbi:MAG: hypothetical protein K5864_09045 [Bacteroidales bacterium]|nr:hypothetical protein [Bacteroidales bacterium]